MRLLSASLTPFGLRGGQSCPSPPRAAQPQSIDPNDIVRAGGIGVGRFRCGRATLLPYIIHFENIPIGAEASGSRSPSPTGSMMTSTSTPSNSAISASATWWWMFRTTGSSTPRGRSISASRRCGSAGNAGRCDGPPQPPQLTSYLDIHGARSGHARHSRRPVHRLSAAGQSAAGRPRLCELPVRPKAGSPTGTRHRRPGHHRLRHQ